MIQSLIFGILFLKKLFQAYNFLYLSSRSSGYYQSFLFNLDFQAESRKANKRKRSFILQYCFAPKTLLILRTSTHLELKITCYCFSHFVNFTLSLSLRYSLNFTKKRREKRRFFAYMAASPYRVISEEVENHISRHKVVEL